VTDLVYVYAILPRPVSTPLTGIENRTIRWVIAHDLAAAVSDVPEDQFDEEPLNANVRDMGWLGPRAVAHQEINARLHEVADAIVPLAFGTVFRDDDRVLQMLTEQAGALTTRLEEVHGAAEWVVALHLLREPDPAEVAAASSAVQALRAEVEASSPGRAHLLRRQLAELERVEARRLQAETATAVLERLRSVATDTYQESLPADAAERPLLRASVLVPRADEARFLDTVHDLRERWPEPTYRVLVTGPWPPYRFAGLDRCRA
jgi:Gas vesicle synthesis protein GvpL/GvpF